MKMKKKKQQKRMNAWIVFLATIVFSIIVVGIAWLQLMNYEKGILDVYAVQQDGYVQLVLDQINLEKNRKEEEIIQNILGTLDASSNRYWTLSKKGSLIFVKDVLETNRYKGFTTGSYYTSSTAENFIKELRTNKVTHDTIIIGNKSYVASGVSFTYAGKSYAMCLLTGADTILDQNEYLRAKVCLSLLVVIAAAIVVIGGLVLVVYSERWYKKYVTEAEKTGELIATIEKLNNEVNQDRLYHTQHMAFYAKSLQLLLPKIERRDVWPLEFLHASCEKEQRDAFFENVAAMMDRKTIRIIMDEENIVLIVIHAPKWEEQEVSEMVIQLGGSLQKRLRLEEKPDNALTYEFATWYQEVE